MRERDATLRTPFSTERAHRERRIRAILEDGLVRDAAHGGLDLVRHLAVDVSIDDQHSPFPHDEATVVHRRPIGEQGIDSRSELPGGELDTPGMERRGEESRWSVSEEWTVGSAMAR